MSSRFDTPTPIAVSIAERFTSAGPSRRAHAPASEPPVNVSPAKLGREVSIIIVNYNVREFLRQSLLSLRPALQNLAAEIFVVDNASSDGSVEMVRQKFPEVVLIANRENVGFARANNQALRLATGRVVVLLNPDTVVQEDTFTAIQTFFAQHPATGMVGCKVLNPDGTLQLACRRSFPTPWIAFTRLSGLSRLFPRSRWFGRYNLTYLPENETTEVEAISGSFMAVRRDALAQVGFLDEEFFMYGEDLDWCFRLRAAGWKIHYFPGTQIIHFKGESAKQSDLDNLRLFYQAMILFVRKHFRPEAPAGFYKGKPGLRPVSYWLLHIAIWFRGLLALAQSLARKLAAPLTDLALMQLSMMAAVWWRFDSLEVWPRFLIVDAVYSLIWLICLALLGCYRQSRYSFYQAFAATLAGFFINASLTYFFKQYAFSRAVILAAGLMNLLLLAGWRLAAKVSRRSGLAAEGKSKRTIVVGDFAADGALLEGLKKREEENFDLVGLISLNAGEVGNEYAGLPVLGSLDHLDDWLNVVSLAAPINGKTRRVQQVIFATQSIPYARILEVLSQPRALPVSFKLVSSRLDAVTGKAGITQMTEVPLVEIENRLLRLGPAFGKRMLDVAIAAFFLLFGAPFFLLLWLLNGKLQSRLVARADCASAPLRLWELSSTAFHKSPALAALAKWPWLGAILAGKLSWVGMAIPPERANLTDAQRSCLTENRPLDTCRLHLPLGVFDLTRVYRGGQLAQEEKDKLYLYYITHYSPLLDVEILLRTALRF